jgi:hypothetical protein
LRSGFRDHAWLTAHEPLPPFKGLVEEQAVLCVDVDPETFEAHRVYLKYAANAACIPASIVNAFPRWLRPHS